MAVLGGLVLPAELAVGLALRASFITSTHLPHRVTHWSGRPDSNRHHQLGRLRSCRWMTPASRRPSLGYPASARPDSFIDLERTAGIEPAQRTWQARRLPLHHVRALVLLFLRTPLPGALRGQCSTEWWGGMDLNHHGMVTNRRVTAWCLGIEATAPRIY